MRNAVCPCEQSHGIQLLTELVIRILRAVRVVVYIIVLMKCI